MGTTRGVVKCRTVNRMPEDQRWSKQRVLELKGFPWAPVPGVRVDHIPVEIKDSGRPTTVEEETVETENPQYPATQTKDLFVSNPAAKLGTFSNNSLITLEKWML